jgi:hypothetical protein
MTLNHKAWNLFVNTILEIENDYIYDLDKTNLPITEETDITFFQSERFTQFAPGNLDGVKEFIDVKLAEECTELAQATLKRITGVNNEYNYMTELVDVWNTLLLKIKMMSVHDLQKFLIATKMKRYAKVRV